MRQLSYFFAISGARRRHISGLCSGRDQGLHQGLIRAIISRIGGEAGISATYWQSGICVYEKDDPQPCSH
jgi:hypothetical protein